jgi:hypothetical protein
MKLGSEYHLDIEFRNDEIQLTFRVCERPTLTFDIPTNKLDEVIIELQKIQTDLKIKEMYEEHHQ